MYIYIVFSTIDYNSMYTLAVFDAIVIPKTRAEGVTVFHVAKNNEGIRKPFKQMTYSPEI